MTQQSSRTPGYTTTLGLPKAELNFASAFSYHNHPHPAHAPHSVHQQQPHHQQQQHQQQQHQQQHQQQQNRNSPIKREIPPQEVKHGATPRSLNRDSESYSGHTGYIVHNYKTASPGPSQTHRGSSPRQSPNLGPIPSKPAEKQSYTYPAPSRTPTEAFDQGRMYQDSRRYNSSPNIRQSPSPALTHPQTMPAPKNPSPGLNSNVPYRPSPGITTGIPVFRPAESSIALTTKPSPSPSPLSRSYYPERTPPPSQISLKHPSPQMEPLDLGKKPCYEDSQAKKQKLESLEVLPPSRMISVAELISSTLDKETPQHPQLGRGLKIIDTDSKGSVLAFTADVKSNVSPPKDGRVQPPQFAYPREHVIREPVISREPVHRETPREAPRDLSREMHKDFREQQRDLRPVNNEANRTHRESSTDQRDIVQDMSRSRESVSYQSVINTRDLPRDPVIDPQKSDVNLNEPQPIKMEVNLESDAARSSKAEENLGPGQVLVKDDIDIKKDHTEAESVSPPRIETKSETDSSAPASTNGSAQPVRKLKAAWLQRMANNDSVTPSIKPLEEGGLSDQTVATDTKPEVTTDKDDKRAKKGKKSDSSAESDESDKEKKTVPNDVTLPPKSSKNPFNKPSVASLKKSGESFLQDSPCYEVAPRLGKCRECRMAPPPKGKKVDLIPNANIFCRFYAFRRLRYTKTGQLAVAGFSDPGKDPQEEDLSLWLPNHNNPPTDLDTDVATFLLNNVGDQFCKLLQVEKEAAHLQNKDGQPIAWKRVVQGVREMCDVCETTLFNFHWVCGKCGFVACIDCYRARFSVPGKERDAESENKENGNKEKESGKLNGHDSRGWLLCSNRFAHLLDSLMPTQIIAGNALDRVSENLHLTRAKLGLPQNCGCAEAMKYKSETENVKNGSINKIPDSNSLTRVRGIKPGGSGELKLPAKVGPSGPSEVDQEESTTVITKFIHEVLLADDALSNGTDGAPPAKRLKVFGEQHKPWCLENNSHCSRSPRLMTNDYSKLLYPTVPHSLECEGTLLRIENSFAPGSQDLFHDQWMRGQPVVVAKVSDKLNVDLWTPESFSREFGSTKNHFVNCITGNIVPNQPMSKFWEGFEKYSKRLKDEKGQPMLLKLKDWPQTDDFAELLTTRFEDLMRALPFGDYTQRNGRYNLAGRLPDCFVRPDLGPKMYVAYGHPALHSVGTTNLHVDVSCAVNVMVNIGVPQDTPNNEDLLQESFKCLEYEKVDNSSIHRIKKNKSIPGAIWHIYHANDADKIRDLLTKVALEKGETIIVKTDPIHDQVNYLDSTLRERLYKEYNVRGYTIVQCLGDAVFIPAGAPHQVRNLNSCIKVAEDFVSPENISRCLQLTEEFRSLSEKHGNHEDKLQLKNIIYHAVKDCLSVLSQNNGSDVSEN
ncbi:lysine-specific demethylase 3A-like isoform X3 [Artemia franciscana]